MLLAFAMRPRLRLAAVALGLGALAALGQAPFGAWYLTLPAFACFFGLLQACAGSGRAGLVGWVFGVGYFAVALHWIVEPFLVDVARHGWMAPFALVFLAVGLALFWLLAAMVNHRAGRSVTGFVAAFTLAEALRGWVFTGFPWAQPGHVWIGTPVMQWASLVGALGLCALTLLLAAVLWQVVARRWALAGLGAGLGLALWLGGGLLNPVVAPSDDAPVVRLIQPNAAQHEKWDPEMMPVFFQRQLGFTAALPRPDLIVWSETAIPSYLGNAAPVLERMSFEAEGQPLIVGARRLEGQRLYNSMALLGPAGEIDAIYDKHHLVPFGEFVPFGDFLGRFGITGLAAGEGYGFSSGPGGQLIGIPGIGTALPLICYEGVFPRLLRAAPARADLILLITNDAWFGTFSGPYQHFAQARLRSVEQGLPMIRVANTGISAVIDARGQVTGALALGEAGYLDLPVPPANAPTAYARLGDGPILILLVLMLAWAAARARQHARPVSN